MNFSNPKVLIAAFITVAVGVGGYFLRDKIIVEKQTSDAAGSADLNFDGKVDVIDLGIFLANWNATNKPSSDLNSDSKVDVIDLGILLSKWGDQNDNLALLDIFVIPDDGTLMTDDDIDLRAAVRRFYALYPERDVYDFLNVITTTPTRTGARHVRVKDPVDTDRGIGAAPWQVPIEGSSRLRGINSLGPISIWENAQLVEQNMWLLDHEAGHQWLYFLLGPDFGGTGVHYSNFANTGFLRDGEEWADVFGGFIWHDNGDGTMSIPESFYSAKEAFSPLSLYLMGFVPPSEVPNFSFVVPQNPTDSVAGRVTGSFKTFSIEDVIERYGQREPSYLNSQKDFRMAYLIVHKKDVPPAPEQLEGIAHLARTYPEHWSFVTNGLSTINR